MWAPVESIAGTMHRRVCPLYAFDNAPQAAEDSLHHCWLSGRTESIRLTTVLPFSDGYTPHHRRHSEHAGACASRQDRRDSLRNLLTVRERAEAWWRKLPRAEGCGY